MPNLVSDPSPASRPSPKFSLENTTDDVLATMDTTQLLQFIINARELIATSPGAATPKTNRLLYFNSSFSSSTPKMDRVRFSVASGGLTTYLGPVHFFGQPAEF